VSAPTVNGSRYPADVEDLMPAARDLAIAADRVPSINTLRGELKIGYDKAAEIYRRLDEQARRYDETVAGPSDPDMPDELPVEDVPEPQATAAVEPAATARPARTPWWIVGLVAPAFVAIWSGWVGLGELTGFGPVNLLPGIGHGFTLNTAITLPVGMETYAAYALKVWLTPALPRPARLFAGWSSLGALLLGAAGQVAYHNMTAAGITHAPVWITTLVACLPVGVLGMGAALAHLLRTTD
jgi:hypothetical protein